MISPFCFNSILVQLEAMMPTPWSPLKPSFNSILVQLEGLCRVDDGVPRRSFNSILVQLEAYDYALSITEPDQFQFHIGAIRSQSS